MIGQLIAVFEQIVFPETFQSEPNKVFADRCFQPEAHHLADFRNGTDPIAKLINQTRCLIQTKGFAGVQIIDQDFIFQLLHDNIRLTALRIIVTGHIFFSGPAFLAYLSKR